MVQGSLVTTTTKDGLFLHGFFHPPADSNAGVVLFVHGLEGNFFETGFIYPLMDKLSERGVGFLTVNTRGNGRETNFNTTYGGTKTIGAWHELLEDAYLDIDAWISWLEGRGVVKNIFLQGHSLGTHKVVRYLVEGTFCDRIAKLLLLAPYDKNMVLTFLTKRTVQEVLPIAQQNVENGNGSDIFSDDVAFEKMSYATFVSWFTQDDIGHIFSLESDEYVSPIPSKITIPVFIALGGKDDYFYPIDERMYEEKLNSLVTRFANVTSAFFPTADHSFVPVEKLLAEKISLFVSQ